jgi:hypothetical protein
MRDRAISIADLNQPRLRMESKAEVTKGDWYEELIIQDCPHGSYRKTFKLLAAIRARSV